MSKFILSKYSESPISSECILYKENSISGDEMGPFNDQNPLPSSDQKNHLFLRVETSAFKSEKNILSAKYRMIIVSGTQFNDDVEFSLISEEAFGTNFTISQAHQRVNQTNQHLIGKSHVVYFSESNFGYVEFELTNYIINRLTTGDNHIYLRISNNSTNMFNIINPTVEHSDLSVNGGELNTSSHFDGLVITLSDPLKDTTEVFGLNDGEKCILNYVSGDFLHMLPMIGNISHALSNTRSQNKSNLLSSLYYTIKSDVTKSTLIDYLGNESIYRTLHQNDLEGIYGVEVEQPVLLAYFNINDFSYSINMGSSNNIEIIYPNGLTLNLFHIGQFDHLGNKIYRLEGIKNNQTSILEIDWSNTNQAIIHKEDEVTIVSFSDTKIDSIEIPKWHRKYNMVYEQIQNRYYLKEVRQYNQDELGDGLIDKKTITYNQNNYLSTIRLDEYLVYYTYLDNKLTRIQMGSLADESDSYDFDYYPFERYTKITNKQDEVNVIYYNQLEQKTLVTDGENYKTFEPYKNSSGYDTLERKEIIDTKQKEITKSEYQIIQGNLIDGWEGFSESQYGDLLVENNFFPEVIGQKIINYKGQQNEVREFKTTVIPLDRQTGDEWFVSAWIKADMIDLETAQLKITIHKVSGSEEVIYYDFDTRNKDWQIRTGHFKCESNYQTITCAISYKGVNDLKIGKVKLYKQKIDNLLEFNEQNQIEKINIDGEFVEYVYDKGKIVKAITPSGRIFDYTYDDNSNITSIRDFKTKFKIEYTYVNNLLVKESTTSDEGFVSTSSYEYDEKGLVIKYIDDEGFTQNYVYDKYGRLIQTQDTSGIVHQTEYNMKNKITKYRYQLNENSDGGIFDYGATGGLYRLHTNNETQYEFESLLYGRSLKKVSVDGKSLESRDYGTGNLRNNLISNKYGNKNIPFKYEYNEKRQIVKKKYNENDLVSISYADDHLTFITDGSSNQTKSIYFDEFKKYIKEVNKINGVEYETITYAYDDADLIIKKAYSLDNQTIAYDYNRAYDFRKNNLNSYLEKISIRFLNDYLSVSNISKTIHSDHKLLGLSATEYVSDIKQNVIRLNDVFGCIVMDVNQINKNRVDQKKYGDLIYNKANWMNSFTNNKIIYGWIKVSGENQEDKEILRMGEVALYLDTNLRVKIKYNSNEMLTQIVVNTETWFMVSLRLTQTQVIVTVNNHDESFAVDYKANQVDYISIGNYPNANPTQTYLDSKVFEPSSLVMDILYMGYGTNNVTTNSLKLMYFEGTRHFNQPQEIIATQTSYFNASVYEGSEVFSLNGHTLSSKGRKPSSYKYGNPNQIVHKLKQFKYDEQLLRYVYESFSHENDEGPELSYNVDLKQQGSINLFIKPEETTHTTTRTIFSLTDQDNNVVFNLFMDYTFRLRFILLGSNNSTTYTINPSTWHMVTFVWENNVVKIYVNNQLVHQQTVNTFDFSDTTLFIGSRGGAYNPIRHLEGYLEMVSVWDSVLTTGQLEKLYMDGLPTMVESKLDSKGRLVENVIYNVQNTLIKTYGYHDEVYTEHNETKIKLGKVPVFEVALDGTKINYKYDENYNVVEKENLDTSGEPTMVTYYIYDSLKRLSKEIVNHVTMNMTNPNEPIRIETCIYAYEYQYDHNSNITKKTRINGTEIDYEDTYIYDASVKDRLNRITRLKNNQTTTHYELTYDQNYQFWPSQILKENTNHQLLWQGPQLMMFGNYQYQYNENGIRVKKTGGGLNIKYDVDGTQVVRSTDLINNKSLIYHYDQNNQVIGLNYSGKEYMYQRNILGEICGIIDLNGKEFINYTYNAYGVPSITLGTNLNPSEMIIASDLAQLNIYLYKGYIYDNETKLYYCQTRYYDPEIGRWLSIDHIAYLDSESIGGLNLYAYCGNNPVMYLDRDGTSPEWWQWLLSGLMIVGGALLLFVPGMQLAGGALIGGGVGSIAGGYIAEAHGYDFNVGYSIGMGVGALIGASIVYAAPIIGQFMSSSWSFGAQTIMTASGQFILTQGVTITGAQVLAGTGALALGGYLLFGKGRPQNNQKQNEQFRAIMNRFGINKSDPRWRYTHDSLKNEKPMDFKELLEFIKQILGL